MKDHSILDSEIIEIDKEQKLKDDRKKNLKIIIGLIIINTILFGIIVKNPKSITDNLLTALNANLIGFNVLGFLIGAIVSIFPYKELSYKKKYLRSSLLTIMILQIIMTVCLILLGLMTLVGWY